MNQFTKNGVAKYYQRLGSWVGYNLVLGRSQHAGYWTNDTKNEREAQQNYLSKMLEMLHIQPTERVLDAGSGQGYAARFLAERTGAKITGITITPREVQVSRKLSKKYIDLDFVLGDYSATNFDDATFDVIYTTETLSHAVDMKKTMVEFYRILKPGGRVIFFDYEIDTRNLSDAERKVRNFLQIHAGGYGINQQNPGEISRAMQEAGFVSVHEQDWSAQTKPTYDRLRKIAKPFSWIQPESKLAPYFVNAVMASHSYSNLYEAGKFRYIVYSGEKR